VGVLAVLVLVLIHATDPESAGERQLSGTSPIGDWSKGSPDAPVHLIEYSDLQCPACVRYHAIVKKVIDASGEDLLFTFRHYPLKMHRHARLAAMCAEAAGLQGKFWEMHDLLFERQKEWERRGKPGTEELFGQYAKQLNLDLREFRLAIGCQTVREKISKDIQSGDDAGVTSTPTFYLNGRKVLKAPRSYEGFRKLILKTKRSLR